MPEHVRIDDKEYKLTFVSELEPAEDVITEETERKVNGICFYPVDAVYNCYVAYANNGEPYLYFLADDCASAKAYYTDPAHFEYACVKGNLLDTSHEVHVLSNADVEKFEELLQFSLQNAYRPLEEEKATQAVKKIRFSDSYNWTDGEYRFFKSDLDGTFVSGKQFIYREVDGKAVLLRFYDFENSEVPEVEIVELPEPLGSYFGGLMRDMQTDK